MRLAASAPHPAPAPTRPRLAWDHRKDPEIWQTLLPHALSEALMPLQPRLVSLAAAAVPPATSPQSLLDSVYAELEQLLAETCLAVVGTRVLTRKSRAWFRMPGVQDAYAALGAATSALFARISDDGLHTAYCKARKEWRAISGAAKLQEHVSLCSAVALGDNQARWTLFKRTAPSSYTPLSTIQHPVSGDLPVSHLASLDNLCSAFVASAQPPPPHDPVGYAALTQRVASWADTALPANPHAIPAHCSDAWTFTLADVRDQCQWQRTKSAPGPDSILPVFLRYAGDAGWQALADIFSFSWRFSVTPLAWREANVMALWKEAGSKSLPSSYRPISMTSIIARTFEHLVQRRLVALLDPPPVPAPQPNAQVVLPQPAAPAAALSPHFAKTQFGFRRGRTTADAIHFLLSNIQHLLRQETPARPASPGRAAVSKQHPLCPVLFLDIKKSVRPSRPPDPAAAPARRRHPRQGLAMAALVPVRPAHPHRGQLALLGLAAHRLRRAAGLRAEPAALPRLHRPDDPRHHWRPQVRLRLPGAVR